MWYNKTIKSIFFRVMDTGAANKPSRISKNNFSAAVPRTPSLGSKNGAVEIDKKHIVMGVFSIICLILLAYLFFDFRNKDAGKQSNAEVSQPSQTASIPTTPSQPAPPSGPQMEITSATDAATAELVQTVFKHIFLPSGNVQVATVVKPDELRKVDPVFYQFAKEGDKVLIYADRAILYDPVADKVLDVVHVSNQPIK